MIRFERVILGHKPVGASSLAFKVDAALVDDVPAIQTPLISFAEFADAFFKERRHFVDFFRLFREPIGMLPATVPPDNRVPRGLQPLAFTERDDGIGRGASPMGLFLRLGDGVPKLFGIFRRFGKSRLALNRFERLPVERDGRLIKERPIHDFILCV